MSLTLTESQIREIIKEQIARIELLEEGKVKIPPEVDQWLNDHEYELVERYLESYEDFELEEPYEYYFEDCIKFSNPYDPSLKQSIEIAIMNYVNQDLLTAFDKNSLPDAGFDYDQQQIQIYSFNIHKRDPDRIFNSIKSLIIHEMVHAVDPKINQIGETEDQDLVNKIRRRDEREGKEYYNSDLEVDAYTNQFIHVLINKYGEDQLLQIMRAGQLPEKEKWIWSIIKTWTPTQQRKFKMDLVSSIL